MKYATLALLGLASAKKGMLGRPDEMDFMFKKPKCEVDESGNIYGELQYMKAFSRTIMNSYVQGFYHDPRENPMPEACFGDWMDEGKEPVKKVFDMLMEGNLFIHEKDAQAAADTIIRWIWKNGLDCQFYNMQYDMYEWCSSDIKGCYDTDLLGNLANNMFPLMGEFMNIFTLTTQDDSCFNDTQVLEEIGSLVKSMSSVMSYVIGFEGKFVPNEKVEKLTMDKMGDNLDDLYDDYMAKNPVPETPEDMAFPI